MQGSENGPHHAPSLKTAWVLAQYQQQQFGTSLFLAYWGMLGYWVLFAEFWKLLYP